MPDDEKALDERAHAADCRRARAEAQSADERLFWANEAARASRRARTLTQHNAARPARRTCPRTRGAGRPAARRTTVARGGGGGSGDDPCGEPPQAEIVPARAVAP
jgi:hypothetical protein